MSIRLFSPGNDGDVNQTISTVSQSIATTVNSTVQNVTQIVQNVTHVMPPPPIQVVMPPAVLPTIELDQPAASVLPQLDALFTPLIQHTAALLEQTAAMATTGIALVSPAAAPTGRSKHTRRAKPKPKTDGKDAAHAPPATVPQSSSSFPAPPAARAPATASSSGRAAAPPQARPASKSAAHRVPARTPRAPFGPSSELSVASAAPGTGSAGGTGLAILVGALLFAAPYATRWLRDAPGSRPRAPFLRRPERPG